MNSNQVTNIFHSIYNVTDITRLEIQEEKSLEITLIKNVLMKMKPIMFPMISETEYATRLGVFDCVISDLTPTKIEMSLINAIIEEYRKMKIEHD